MAETIGQFISNYTYSVVRGVVEQKDKVDACVNWLYVVNIPAISGIIIYCIHYYPKSIVVPLVISYTAAPVRTLASSSSSSSIQFSSIADNPTGASSAPRPTCRYTNLCVALSVVLPSSVCDLKGTSKNCAHPSATTELPPNDSGLFSLRFIDVLAVDVAVGACRPFFEVPFLSCLPLEFAGLAGREAPAELCMRVVRAVVLLNAIEN